MCRQQRGCALGWCKAAHWAASCGGGSLILAMVTSGALWPITAGGWVTLSHLHWVISTRLESINVYFCIRDIYTQSLFFEEIWSRWFEIKWKLHGLTHEDPLAVQMFFLFFTRHIAIYYNIIMFILHSLSENLIFFSFISTTHPEWKRRFTLLTL